MVKDKVLITGANGFIGRFLVQEALKNDLDVFAAVRKNSNISSLDDLAVSLVEIDYTNIQNIADILKQNKFTYIIHNAGVTKTPDPKQYMRVNRDYLKNIVEAIKIAGFIPKKFLFVSSMAACGPADFQSDGKVYADSLPHPVTNYGKSKLEGEKLLTSQHDIPYIIIRPTAVYGPGEKDLLNVFKMLNKRIDIQAGIIPPVLTFMYVKDLARLIFKALLNDKKNRIYFATDGHVYQGRAFSGFILQSLNKKALQINLPIPLLSALAFLIEKAAGIWDSYPPLNRDKVNEIKARNWNCDIANLATELDFRSEYDLSTGIPETVNWYKANKWL